MDEDDDAEKYMDPELDPVEGEDDSLAGPLSFPALVVGIHLLTALAFLPFAWSAYSAGDVVGTVTYGALSVAIVVVGLFAGRYTSRGYEG